MTHIFWNYLFFSKIIIIRPHVSPWTVNTKLTLSPRQPEGVRVREFSGCTRLVSPNLALPRRPSAPCHFLIMSKRKASCELLRRTGSMHECWGRGAQPYPNVSSESPWREYGCSIMVWKKHWDFLRRTQRSFASKLISHKGFRDSCFRQPVKVFVIFSGNHRYWSRLVSLADFSVYFHFFSHPTWWSLQFAEWVAFH